MRRAASTTITVLLLATNVWARPGDVQKADTLFREGRAAMKAGDLGRACPALEESYGLDPAPGTAVNLGDCFEKQGKVASALLAYQAARKLLKPGDPRVGPVEQQIAALEKRAPKLTITLAPDAPEGTTVTRDGKAVDFAELGSPLVVNPGDVVIIVTAPGRNPTRTTVTLAESETRHFVANAGSLIRRPVQAPSNDSVGQEVVGGTHAEAEQGTSQRTWGYLLLGVGVAAVGIGGVFWKLAEDTHSAPCPKGDCTDLNDKEREQRTVANVAAGVGVTALVGGGALVLLSPDPADKSVALRASPALGGNTWAINFGGVW